MTRPPAYLRDAALDLGTTLIDAAGAKCAGPTRVAAREKVAAEVPVSALIGPECARFSELHQQPSWFTPFHVMARECICGP
jgi:hypothetical protein